MPTSYDTKMYFSAGLRRLHHVEKWALFCFLPPESLLVGHVGSNAIVMGGLNNYLMVRYLVFYRSSKILLDQGVCHCLFFRTVFV